MVNLSPANEARLRAAIRERGLQAAEELIVFFAVECATLCTVGPDDYSQTGTSRYGGVPDLPDEAMWPQSAEGKFYNFYMQINLADVLDFVGNVLPRCGMLYCFIDGIADASVLWADVEPSHLTLAAKKATELTDWGNSTTTPYQIKAYAGIDIPQWASGPYKKITDGLSEVPPDENGVSAPSRYNNLVCAMQNRDQSGNRAGKLLGQPMYWRYDPDEERKLFEEECPPSPDLVLVDGGTIWLRSPQYDDRRLLMMLDTCKDVGVAFGDGGHGYVQIFIGSNALAAHNFSSVEPWFEPLD